MNKETQRAISAKKRKWKKYKCSPSTFAIDEYKKVNINCTKIIRKAKKSFEHKIASEIKSNPKSFWNYVNSQRKCKPNIPNLLKSDMTLTLNDNEKADTLNTFFSSVFVNDTDFQPEILHSKTYNRAII